MARLNADTIANSAGTGAPSFPFGANITAGQSLGVDSITDAATTGGPSFPNGISGTVKGLNSSSELYNLGLSVTASSNNLVIALKQTNGSDPSTGVGNVKIGFRSPTSTSGNSNERISSSALSLTINQFTTLGLTSGTPINLYVYMVDSDGLGTLKLATTPIYYDSGSLQSTVKESFTGTVTINSPGVWTATGHGLNNADAIRITTTGALPTGLTANTTYWVVSSSTNTFQLSTVPGGSAINTTGTQSGVHTIRVANSRMVSDAAYSSVAVTLIGRILVSQTSGSWGSPTEVSPFPVQIKPSIAAMMSLSTDQSSIIGNGSVGTVAFDTADLDSTGSMVSTGGNCIVIPVTGLYFINIQLSMSNLSDTFTRAQSIVIKNGAGLYGVDSPTGGKRATPTVSILANLSAGDIISADFDGTLATPSNTFSIGSASGGVGKVSFMSVIKQ